METFVDKRLPLPLLQKTLMVKPILLSGQPGKVFASYENVCKKVFKHEDYSAVGAIIR
jgi:hypothetical protein